MKFEYNLEKSMRNKEKYGVALTEAEVLWSISAVEIEAKTVLGELRHMTIGHIAGKLYSCVYTIREDTIRLISLRRSRKAEETAYYEFIKK